MKAENSKNSIIVVAGFSRSHLLSTIGDLVSHKTKVFGVSAIAPKCRLISRFEIKLFHINRLQYRRKLMGNANVKQVRFAEVIHQLAVRTPSSNSTNLYNFFSKLSFRWFSRSALRYSRRVDPENKASLLIRSGFGSAFASDSRKFISDASLPHPNTLKSLVRTGEIKVEEINPDDVISTLILKDTARADLILVNSDFVKETFVAAGVKEDKIVVAYLPPTGHFRDALEQPVRDIRTRDSNFRILYAGTLEERKGVHEILSVAEMALKISPSFEFVFVGNWGTNTCLMQKKLKSLNNCNFARWKTQADLAVEMRNSDVFLFPSHAEGGARVVTEAMSIGMPIITTYNSGAPLDHLVEGIIVKPLDPAAIFEWLKELNVNVSLSRKIAIQARKRIESMVRQDKYLEIVRRVCET